MHNITPTD